MDKKIAFLSKTRTFLRDPKLLNNSVCPGSQEAWPQWCTGPYTVPSVAPCGQRLSSCHTRQWCNPSGCSRWCSCITFWGSGEPWQISSVSWGGKGVVVPSSQLSWCVWTMIVCWGCGHQGTWNSWPAPLQPRRCMLSIRSYTCFVHSIPLEVEDIYRYRCNSVK